MNCTTSAIKNDISVKEYIGELSTVLDIVNTKLSKIVESDNLAKLVALGPFFAKCSKPIAESAKLIVSLFIDRTSEAFSLQEGESVEDYLSDGLFFKTGSLTPELKHRNALLKIVAYNNQLHDLQADLAIGKCNIFQGMSIEDASDFHSKAISEEIAVIRENFTSAIDELMPLQTATIRFWWQS